MKCGELLKSRIRNQVSGSGILIGDDMNSKDDKKSDYPKLPKWWAHCTCKVTDSIHSGYHDAFFCRNCYAWTEPVCSYVECDYCKDRPAYNIYAAEEDRKLINLELLIEQSLESIFGTRKLTPVQETKKRN